MTDRILLTPGEPAGIGPDIVIQIAQQHWPVELVVIADPDLLLERAKLINLPIRLLDYQADNAPSPQQAGTLTIIPIKLHASTQAGLLNPANAAYVLQTLKTAATLCEQKKAVAVVTGPVHKGVMNQAGILFSGHTEFFAEHSLVERTVMLFVVNNPPLRVALATTHLPLADVSKAITKERLKTTLSILSQSLKDYFHVSTPRILICGLNPHAGEGGYLGREEIEIMTPLLDELRATGMQLIGPLPADTLFTPKYLDQADAVLAMYHDQALPLVKYISFGHAVNVTLGLPFVRTSVDHGTAVDMAGTGGADAGSMKEAVQMACTLSMRGRASPQTGEVV